MQTVGPIFSELDVEDVGTVEGEPTFASSPNTPTDADQGERQQ